MLGCAGAILVLAFVLRERSRLVIALVSSDLARTVGIDVRRLDLVYLLAFALTVALGLRYLEDAERSEPARELPGADA